MRWQEFKHSAPELAALGEERFERTGLILLGTLRKHGWPRISPVESLIVDGELYLGMMLNSTKARDLLRDSRCVVHSTVSNKDGSEGEFKLYGRANEIQSQETKRRYGEALYQKIGWEPEDSEYHLFSIEIESAAYVGFENDEKFHEVWKAG